MTPDNENKISESFVEVSTLSELKNALAGDENAPENRGKNENNSKKGHKTESSPVGRGRPSGSKNKGGKSGKKAGGKKTEKSGSGRNADGTFVPGHSGNPGGRPKKSTRLLEMGEYAEEQIYKMMQNPKTPRGIRVDLYKYVHDKAFGRATQAVDVDGKMDQTVSTTVKFEGVLDEWSE